MRKTSNLALFLLFVAGLGLSAATPSDAYTQPDLGMSGPLAIRGVSLNRSRVGRFGKLEITVDLSATYANPFDPDQIDLGADFSGPNGEAAHIDGFLDQPFDRALNSSGTEELTPAGPPVWRIRFAPDRVGAWKAVVTARDASGVVRSAPIAFTVTASINPGFVRRSKRSPSMFAFAGERPYFPIGEDMGWGNNGGTFNYDEWLAKLHVAGGNWVRVWMGNGSNRIEWSKGSMGDGLGVYDLARAWRVDRILDTARQDGIYVMLSLGTYGELQSGGYWGEGDWPTNPYNSANGGPCATPEDDAVNPIAKKFYRQRLRYIVARYGWNTAIQSWEFWNETPAPAPWIGEMAQYLKGAGPFSGHAADPYRHLISTTWGSPEVWAIPQVDFTQTHYYGEGDIPDLAPGVVSDARANLGLGKPHMLAESGITWKGPDKQFDPAGKGVDLHNTIWASAASGNAGSAMIWWWDSYVDPDNLYHEYTPLARFAATIPWTAGPWRPLTASTAITDVPTVAPRDCVLLADLGWGKTAPHPYSISNRLLDQPGGYPSILYGDDKPQWRKPVEFDVDFAKAGSLVLHVESVSSSAQLSASIDGVATWSHAFSAAPVAEGVIPEYKSTAINKPYTGYRAEYDKDFSFPIPAGSHRVVLGVGEGDWMSVSSYTLTGYVSDRIADVRIVATANPKCAVLWAQNRASNWYNVLHNITVAPVRSARTVLTGLTPGVYTVNWFDTGSGAVARTVTVKATKAGLALALPDFATDVAASISRAD
jgi:hypothetical protein